MRADEHVEPPEPLGGGRHRAARLGVVREVGHVRDDPLRGGHPGRVAVDREHGVTGGRERRA